MRNDERCFIHTVCGFLLTRVRVATQNQNYFLKKLLVLVCVCIITHILLVKGSAN